MKNLNEYIKENIISEWSPAPAVAARNALNKSFYLAKLVQVLIQVKRIL
jgi:hypothetical protein